MMLSKAQRGYLASLLDFVGSYGFFREEAATSHSVASQPVFKECIDVATKKKVTRVDEKYALIEDEGLVVFTGDNPAIHVL